MKHNEFDDIIRSRMNDMPGPPRPGGHWEIFESRLQQEEEKAEREAEMDELVRRKLNLLHPVYPTKSWNRLLLRLNRGQQVAKRLAVSKVIEILAIAFFLFFWFFPSLLQQKHPNTIAPQVVVLPPLLTITEENSSETDIEAAENQGLTDLVASETSVAKTRLPAKVSENAIQEAFQPSDRVQTTFAESLPPAIEKEFSGLPVELPGSSMGDEAFQNGRLEKTNSSSEESGISMLSEVSRLFPANKGVKFNPNQWLIPDSFSSITPVKGRENRDMGQFFTGVIVLDYNFVMTPFDVDFQEQAYSRGSYGYGLGFAYSRKKGHWEYGLGVSYHQVTYKPRALIEIFDGSVSEGGYFAEAISRITLNTIHIPLTVRHHVVDKGRFGMFVSGGGAVRMTMTSFYDYQRQFVAAAEMLIFPDIANYQQPSPQRTAAAVDTESKLSQRPQPAGLLEGGNFNENHYFTAQLGAGLIYQTGQRHALFAEGILQHRLFSPEIGPNRDRINTFSLQFGIRSAF